MSSTYEMIINHEEHGLGDSERKAKKKMREDQRKRKETRDKQSVIQDKQIQKDQVKEVWDEPSLR